LTANALKTNEKDAQALFEKFNPKLAWKDQEQRIKNIWRMKAFAAAHDAHRTKKK
jgi:hypothetical protein